MKRFGRSLGSAVPAAIVLFAMAAPGTSTSAAYPANGEPHGHHLHDAHAPSVAVMARLGPADDEPLYEFGNSNGQPGSGGRLVAYRSGGRVVSRRGPDARLLHTGFGGWEPTMGVARDGTLYFAARNTNVDPAFIRSDDRGLTWTDATPPHTSSVDPYMWLDTDTGRVFDTDIDPSISCTPTSFSDDGGASWTSTRVCGHVDHQTVFGGPPPEGGEEPQGYPNVVYFCALNGGVGEYSSATTCSKSLDGGESWVPTGDPAFVTDPINEDEGVFCDGAIGHGIVGDDGTVYIPKGLCGKPVMAVSRDEGATWEQVSIAKRPEFPVDRGSLVTGHESGFAIDETGTFYYVWPGKDWHTYLSVSRDTGETWSKPLDVTPPGVTRTALPGIDAGARGRIAITFAGSRAPDDTPVEETTWDGYVVISTEASSADPRLFGGPINDPVGNPLWRGACTAVRCGNLGDFFDVVIDPRGEVWVAFVDSCPGKKDECTSFGVTDPRGEAIVGHLVGGPRLR